MKFLLTCVTAVVFTLAAAGCASTGANAQSASASIGRVPQFVNDAYMKASEDVLIGVGTYTIGSDTRRMSIGKTMAETRARADITRQMQSIMRNMVIDYAAASELDPTAAASFQEEITEALAQADLRGSKIAVLQTDENGVLWVVAEYSKSLAVEDFNAAQAAAKLAVPAALAFDALSRMDTAFSKAAAGGPQPVTE
jgi:hypothetical protein